jgi:hypothetical protein
MDRQESTKALQFRVAPRTSDGTKEGARFWSSGLTLAMREADGRRPDVALIA